MTDETQTQESAWIIRPLDGGDYGNWRSLWDRYLRFYESDVDEETTMHTWQQLINNGTHEGFVCASSENPSMIAGFTHYFFFPSSWNRGGYCYLEDLFVGDEFRGQGVGRLLIAAVAKATKSKGVAKVYWHTQHENEAARRLYDSVGRLVDSVQYVIEIPRSGSAGVAKP